MQVRRLLFCATQRHPRARQPARAPIGRFPYAFRALAHRACCPICPTLATESHDFGPGHTLGVRRPARAAAYLSIGVEGLLPRAHGGGDDTARGQKWLQGRLSRQDRQNSAERARSQAELGLRWTTIKATIRISELCRGTRALYRPCSMPVRTHKTGAQLATTGTQDQSQDALPQTMTSPQLSDFVCFHDFGRLRLTHAGLTPDAMRASIRTPAEDADACRNGQRGPRRSHTVHS